MSDTSSNVDALIKKVISLSAEGNLDEAIICGRSAIRLAPDNANAWWQLGHVQLRRDGQASALESFKKTTELAPSFAAGWCQLGIAYQKTGQLSEAIESYEEALLQDEEHAKTLKLLAPALESRGLEGDEERRLDVLKKLDEIGELDDASRFDLAYALNEGKEYHRAQRLYEKHYLLNPSPTVANNLGVTHERQGRNLDAIDCFRLAVKGDPESERYKNNLSRILKLVIPYETSIEQNPNIVSPNNWYRNYINPYVLMGFQGEVDVSDVKLIQRQKKALYQEIKLEEGKISWLNNHVVDSSAAMDICEKINDPEYSYFQYEIYEQSSLCDFLMTGNLRYFLSKESDGDAYFELNFQRSGYFISEVSKIFAMQFDMVLCKALEQKNFRALQCLLGGRRLVSESDVDLCFSGARRIIEQMLEPIKSLAEKSKCSKVDARTAKTACSKDSINTLLSILPSEFNDAQREYYGYLFTLSREVYRNDGGIEAAIDLIELAEPIAGVCVDVSDRLGDAKRQLKELLAEEKKKEVHLKFGSRSLDITKRLAEYSGIRIPAEEVRGLRWGIMIISNSPRTAEFSVGITNFHGKEINISWTSADIDGQKKNWSSIVDGIIEYLYDFAFDSFKNSMNTSGHISMGGAELNSRGVTITYDGWFSKKSYFAPWSAVKHGIENGDLVLQAKNEQKAVVRLPLASTWNAGLLNYYLNNRKD